MLKMSSIRTCSNKTMNEIRVKYFVLHSYPQFLEVTSRPQTSSLTKQKSRTTSFQPIFKIPLPLPFVKGAGKSCGKCLLTSQLYKHPGGFSTYIHLERFPQSLTDLKVKCKVAKCDKLYRDFYLCVFLDLCLWLCRIMRENIKMKMKRKRIHMGNKTCFLEESIILFCFFR